MSLRSFYLTLVGVSLARAIRANTLDDAIVARFVWSALGTIWSGRAHRVPRAILHDRRRVSVSRQDDP